MMEDESNLEEASNQLGIILRDYKVARESYVKAECTARNEYLGKFLSSFENSGGDLVYIISLHTILLEAMIKYIDKMSSSLDMKGEQNLANEIFEALETGLQKQIIEKFQEYHLIHKKNKRRDAQIEAAETLFS